MPLIIAEIGVNHMGSLTAALHLADAAKAAGADVAKYQIAIPELEATDTAPVAPYQAEAGYKSQRDMIREVMLNRDEFDMVVGHCADIGIEFMASAGDCDSLRWLLDGRVDRIKIGSGDMTNGEMLDVAAESLRPVLLSTGMAVDEEIDEALNHFSLLSDVTLLHCTSSYPCPVEEVNLAAMVGLKTAWSIPVGFSDHTVGYAASVGAAALGAAVIEKHLTLNRMATGPDHSASLDPGQFKFMVDMIRDVEKAKGSPIKQPTPSEIANVSACRKVLVASRPISAGEIFTRANITAKRSHGGRSALRYLAVLGQAATRDYREDESL